MSIYSRASLCIADTAYTFIVWGAIHGTAVAMERLLRVYRSEGWGRHLPVRVAWFFVVQSVVLVAWAYFRCQSVAEAGLIPGNIALAGLERRAREHVGLLFLLPLVLHHGDVWLEEHRSLEPETPAARAVLAGGMVYAIVTLYARDRGFHLFPV